MKSIVNAKKKNSRRYGQNLMGRCEQPDFEKKLCSGTAWPEKKKDD